MPRTDQERRDRSGRYDKAKPCDACGKSVNPETMFTDDEVCQGSDGPGFFLCDRKKCIDNRGGDVAERRRLYEVQRAKNTRAAVYDGSVFSTMINTIIQLDPDISSVRLSVDLGFDISCDTDEGAIRVAKLFDMPTPTRHEHQGVHGSKPSWWLSSSRWSPENRSVANVSGPHHPLEVVS